MWMHVELLETPARLPATLLDKIVIPPPSAALAGDQAPLPRPTGSPTASDIGLRWDIEQLLNGERGLRLANSGYPSDPHPTACLTWNPNTNNLDEVIGIMSRRLKNTLPWLDVKELRFDPVSGTFEVRGTWHGSRKPVAVDLRISFSGPPPSNQVRWSS